MCPTCGTVKRKPSVPHARSSRVSELLWCNDIPSETELSGFQDVVKRGPERIADVDERIMRAKELLGTLVHERKLMQSEISDAELLESPVRRLPPYVMPRDYPFRI